MIMFIIDTYLKLINLDFNQKYNIIELKNVKTCWKPFIEQLKCKILILSHNNLTDDFFQYFEPPCCDIINLSNNKLNGNFYIKCHKLILDNNYIKPSFYTKILSNHVDVISFINCSLENVFLNHIKGNCKIIVSKNNSRNKFIEYSSQPPFPNHCMPFDTQPPFPNHCMPFDIQPPLPNHCMPFNTQPPFPNHCFHLTNGIISNIILKNKIEQTQVDDKTHMMMLLKHLKIFDILIIVNNFIKIY